MVAFRYVVNDGADGDRDQDGAGRVQAVFREHLIQVHCKLSALRPDVEFLLRLERAAEQTVAARSRRWMWARWPDSRSSSPATAAAVEQRSRGRTGAGGAGIAGDRRSSKPRSFFACKAPIRALACYCIGTQVIILWYGPKCGRRGRYALMLLPAGGRFWFGMGHRHGGITRG